MFSLHLICIICSSTETSFDSLLMQQRENENISDALARSVLAFKANLDRRSVANALTNSDLSWKVIQEENKVFVMERLQNILNLSMVYDSMKRSEPNMLTLQIKRRLRMINTNIYRKFLSKCMFVYVH